MKELIIPLFGSISLGTVQELNNKSRPPPHPLAGLTFMRRLFTESSCYSALCPHGLMQDISLALLDSLSPKP